MSIDVPEWSFFYLSRIYHLQMDSYGSTVLPKPLASSLLHFFNGFDDSHSICQFDSPTSMNQSSSPSSPGLHLNTVKGTAFAVHNRHRSAPLNGERSEFDLLDRVSRFERRLFLFSASADGVPIFKYSKVNNSVYIFSLSCENMSRRYVPGHYDSYVVTAVPCNDPGKLQRRGRNTLNDLVSCGGIHYGGSPLETQDVTLLSSLSLFVPEWKDQKEGSVNPVNSDFREILGLLLQEIKEFGKKGFCIRMGNTLFAIQYGIVNFRADLPACNLLMDSSGLMSTNFPCQKCKLSKRFYDPNLMGLVRDIRGTFYGNRNMFSTVISSLSLLPAKDYLRLLPAFLWLRNNEVPEAEVLRLIERLPDGYYRAKELLTSILLVIPPSCIASMGVDTDLFCEYGGTNSFTPHNNQCSTGWIDIRKNTFLSLETAVCIDMMHMFHCIADSFVDILFVNQTKNATSFDTDNLKQLNVSKKISLENHILNLSKEYYGYQKSDQYYDYHGVNPTVRDNLKKRFDKMKALPSTYCWVKDLVNGEPVFTSRRAEEKIVFCSAILPLLMIDSMDEPKVWCMVNLLVLLASFYSHDGSFAEAERLQLLIRVVLCILEMQMFPSFLTIYVHLTLHLMLGYIVNGPMKSGDTFHFESGYRGMDDEATGGSNPNKTLLLRLANKLAFRFLSMSIRKNPEINEDSFTLWRTGSRQVLEDPNSCILMRTMLNWMADMCRYRNDICHHCTFTDLELTNRVNEYIRSNLSQGDTDTAQACCSWRSSKEMVTSVNRKAGLRSAKQSGFTCYKKLARFTYNSHVYTSLRCTSNDLTASTFEDHPTSFAVTYSMDGKCHLLAIYGYIACMKGEDSYYMEAIVYEIPILPSSPLVRSPFCFLIDMDSVTSSRTQFLLISIHRLHIFDLYFTKTAEKEVYGSVFSTCVRQWQIFPSVCLPIKSVEERDSVPKRVRQ